MKKFIVAAVTLFATVAVASAQMRPTIKVEAAANFSNATTKVGDTSKTGKAVVGYRVGVGAEFNLGNDGFYANPGLFFLSRGSKAETIIGEGTLSTGASSTTMLHAVEIPVHFGYRAAFAPNLAVSVQAGPYFAYGFSGKTKSKVMAAGKWSSEIEADPYKKVSDKSALKPFDFGLGGQVALEYSRYYFAVGTEYGLLNTSGVDKTSVNNINFYTGIGVRF